MRGGMNSSVHTRLRIFPRHLIDIYWIGPGRSSYAELCVPGVCGVGGQESVGGVSLTLVGVCWFLDPVMTQEAALEMVELCVDFLVVGTRVYRSSYASLSCWGCSCSC